MIVTFSKIIMLKIRRGVQMLPCPTPPDARDRVLYQLIYTTGLVLTCSGAQNVQ